MSSVSVLACDSEDQMGLEKGPLENEENMLQMLKFLCTHADIASRSTQC